MRTSVVIAALAGAGALAHPQLKLPHLHHHHKRDEIQQWDEGNVHYVEDIHFITATVDPPAVSQGQQGGQHHSHKWGHHIEQAAISSPAPVTLAIQQQFDAPGQPSSTPAPTPQQRPAEHYVPQQQQPSPPTAAPSATLVQQYQQQQPSPTSVAASAPSTEPLSSPGTGSGSDGASWTTSPMSPPGSVSGAQDVLTRANYWRQRWISSLGTFTWNSTLADNSYKTAICPTTWTGSTPHGEGGGVTMGHMLYSGSFAQCIAQGNNKAMNDTFTPFDQAFLMWICEEPNGLDACTTMGYTTTANDTGHAQIIKGTYNQIGCYWMASSIEWGGMWTCDFAGGADDYSGGS